LLWWWFVVVVVVEGARRTRTRAANNEEREAEEEEWNAASHSTICIEGDTDCVLKTIPCINKNTLPIPDVQSATRPQQSTVNPK
jgi:hypothetical protein